MPLLLDFRGRKGAWPSSCQNPAKSLRVSVRPVTRASFCVAEQNLLRHSLYQIMLCILLQLFLCDIAHPNGGAFFYAVF